VASIPYRAVWEALASEWGARFSEAVVLRHTPAEEALLVECRGCGLQFFSPAVPGDVEFYRGLAESPRYYASWKWEFGWVLERLRPQDTVLDVGCGRGDFLVEARKVARSAVGLEMNPAAAAAAAARGVEVVQAEIGGFAADHQGVFDAACAFHVVEHLAEPVPFLRAVVSRLKPGGSLFVSVPNRSRSARRLLEPLDCPPHHLSRWSPAQFPALGAVLSFSVREVACEPVPVCVPREEVRGAVRRALARWAAAGEGLGVWAGRAVTRLLFDAPAARLAAGLGIFERLGYRGHPAVARFEVPLP